MEWVAWERPKQAIVKNKVYLNLFTYVKLVDRI